MTNTTIAQDIAKALECGDSADAALARTTRPLYSTTNFQGMAKNMRA